GLVRAAAKRSKDGPQARRLLALAAIYDGANRTEAAEIGGVTLQIIRDWVMRFNVLGPNGLIDRKQTSPRSRGLGLDRLSRCASRKSASRPGSRSGQETARWETLAGSRTR